MSESESESEQRLAEAQRAHWQQTYGEHPGMYGAEPSEPAVRAAAVFQAAGAREVLELGAGHGRDALYFAREGFSVLATDFSPVGLDQLRQAAAAQGVAGRITTAVHDVRGPLPLADASVDAVFAHMLLCMALSTRGRAVPSSTPSATPGTPTTGPVPGTGTTSGSTAASPSTSSPATWSTRSPRAGPWTRSPPSKRAASPGGCGASPRRFPSRYRRNSRC